ncbi:MAG: DUF4159 domain-containing protein [Gemmatimonadales bacterium]|nr:MAG: DUF4159 domain-containing protein [Gemmatimonadales bacterium]
MALARLRYGGGDWYANPTSLPNLARAIREDLGLDMRDRDVVVEPLDPELRDHPFLHMTGHGAVDFTSEEAAALRAHLEDGGFLHADDNYGMDAAFREAMALVFPDRELVPIPPDHPVFHMVHSLPEGLPKIHEHDGEPPSAWGIFVDGRLAVFYSHESDLGNGWEDPEVHEVPEPLRRQALQMGVNLFAWALAARSP